MVFAPEKTSEEKLAHGPVAPISGGPDAIKLTRRRTLRPDPKGYYRPYVGWTHPLLPYDGEQKGAATQPRFNLGRDPREARRRYNRIQELYVDSCRTCGEDYWTPFALYAAGLLAKGQYRIPYDFQPWMMEWDDPLTLDDILLDHQHEFADMLHFTSTDKDSFCRFFRPKSKIFGEWILWPETVKLLRSATKRAKRNGTDLLFADDVGVGWYCPQRDSFSR